MQRHGGGSTISGASPTPESLFAQLREELPELATRFVDRVQAGIKGYEPGALVSYNDLHETAMTSIGLLLDSLNKGSPQEALLSFAESLGRRRARQGVPVESLSMALQTDFRLIWTRMLEISSEDPEATLVLAHHVEPIWSIVETYSAVTLRFYRSEEAQLVEDRLNHRQIAIGRLLAFQDPSESSITWVSNELGCDAHGDFTVVVADQAESRDALYKLATTLRRSPFYFYRSSGVVVAFWPRGNAPHGVASRVEEIRCARADSVRGLARFPRVVDALTNLLDLIAPTIQRPVDLGDGVPVLARKALAEQGIDVEEALRLGLSKCSESERDKLRETVLRYLETGSVQGTAAALFYHRNTVLKRLNRFAELTGIDVTVPAEAAVVVIAWSSIRP